MTSNSISGDGDAFLTGVPMTSLYTAAARAKESSLPEDQRRFNDPFASKLAGPIIKTFLEHRVSEDEDKTLSVTLGSMHNYILDRTVYFDNVIQKYLIQHSSCKQIVLLGSGMDTRAYRLGLPADMNVFEIDYPDTHDYKTNILKDDAPSCHRIVVKADMTKDNWSALLTSVDQNKIDAESNVVFDQVQPTLWIAEGLLMYIPEADIEPYISCVDALSAQGSAFIFDGLKSREKLSVFAGKASFNFMASLDRDALNVFNNLHWHISEAVDHLEADITFYMMSKGGQKD